MKHFLPILSAISFCVGEPVKKLNVFSIAAIGQLMYKEIHKTQSHKDDRHPITDPEVKEEMCHSVTGSRLFPPYRHERVSMYEIYEELRTEYVDIFNQLYADPKDPSMAPPGRDKIYVNPTEEITVYNPWDNKSHLEYVFVCLVRRMDKFKRDYKKVVKFYISGEYDARDSRKAAGPYKAGRFIFNHRWEYAIPTIFGFFEEPAKVLSASVAFLEKLYLLRANVVELDLPSIQDIVNTGTKTRKKKSSWLFEQQECPTYLSDLNLHEMDRICNIVMNSSHFEILRRSKYDVEDKCHRKCRRMYVSFETADARVAAMGKYYQEWTLGCCTRDDKNEFDAWYHISRANESLTEVFVYRETSEHEMVLENLSTNVRFTVPFMYFR